MDAKHTRGRKRALLGAAIIAMIAAAVAVITAVPAALAAPTAHSVTTSAPSIEKTFVGLVGGKLEWTITIHNPTSTGLEFYVTDDDSSAVLAAPQHACLLGAPPQYCFVAAGANGTATVQTALPANFDECVGGGGTNTVHLFSAANFATAPKELANASADWSIPAASGCCTTNAGQVAAQQVAACRTITLVKLLDDGSADSQTFGGSVSNDPTGTFTGLGVSTSTSTAPLALQETGSQTHVITETVPAGFALDGYALVMDGKASDCFPSQAALTLDTTKPSVTIPDDGENYVVCIQNHRTRTVTIIKQVINHVGDTTPFTVSLNGARLSGSISGNGQTITTTINADVQNTFSEDTPLPAGYHFFAASDHADCSPESITEVGVTSGTSYILGPGTGDVTICFVNFEDPNLSITKTANPAGPVGVGDSIGFDITLTNSGGAIPGVLVPDALPQGANLTWSIVPAVSGCSISGSGASQQLACDFINFIGTQVIHLTSSATVPAVCGKITNTATWQEFAPLQRAESPQISQIPNGSASASVTVDCGGTLTVTKLTETNGIVDGNSSALPWAFTIHSNACAYTSASTATVSGVATFTNVPPCNDYQVTETGSFNGYTAIASTPPSGSITVTSGHTTNVTYLNVRTVASGCPSGQTCRPFVPPLQNPPVTLATLTPTPTVAPPTPTAVPPTAEPTRVSVVLGEKTPGITPAPPSTGNGSAGDRPEVINVALALLGLLAAAGGLAILAAAKGRRG